MSLPPSVVASCYHRGNVVLLSPSGYNLTLASDSGFPRVGARIDRRLYSPLSTCLSADPGRDRHAETRHPVEHIAPDFRLGPLIGQNPGVKSSADDSLVAKHRRFNQTSAIIARASLPTHASMLCNGLEMFVTLRGCRFTCNGCNPWWNNHRRIWVTLGNGVIDDLAIICPVRPSITWG
jgi:hypothetical protein